MQFYTDPTRESETYALPDARVYELTAREVAELDEDTIRSYMRRREFRLAAMSDRVRDAMFDAMIEDNGITGGWFFDYCLPGCLPDSQPFGPYESRDAAIAAARDMSTAA
jgi:hypothetical protein